MTDEQLAEAWKGLATWAKDSAISPLLIKFGRAVATTAVEAERQKNNPETPDCWAQAIPEDRAALAVPVSALIRTLEGQAANTETDWRWLTAQALRANDNWQTAQIEIASPPQPQLNHPEPPDGWQLVPKEPTPEMLSYTAECCKLFGSDNRRLMQSVYRFLLAAAPKEPT